MTSKQLREWDLVSEQNVGFHEAADIFPAMTDDEFETFKKDIAENGLQTPIVTTEDGYILDGRHRWRACMETKTEPRYQIHTGNPWTYVISANLHRRHLNSSQKAMVAARVAIRPAGGDRRSSHFQKPETAFESKPPTQMQTAEMLGIGHTSVTKARRVVKDGIPELASVVDQGLVKVETAARLSRMDKETQRDFVKRVESGEHPLKVAPPYKPYAERKPRGRLIRKPGKDIFTMEHVSSLGAAMSGVEIAFDKVSTLDDAIAPADAKRLLGEMTRATKVLNRIKRLLVIRKNESE